MRALIALAVVASLAGCQQGAGDSVTAESRTASAVLVAEGDLLDASMVQAERQSAAAEKVSARQTALAAEAARVAAEQKAASEAAAKAAAAKAAAEKAAAAKAAAVEAAKKEAARTAAKASAAKPKAGPAAGQTPSERLSAATGGDLTSVHPEECKIVLAEDGGGPMYDYCSAVAGR